MVSDEPKITDMTSSDTKDSDRSSGDASSSNPSWHREMRVRIKDVVRSRLIVKSSDRRYNPKNGQEVS